MSSGAEWAFRFASEVCRNPQIPISRWKSLSGRKTAGCVPICLPEEILHAAGMLPITVWGNEYSHTSPGEGGSHVCSIAGGIISAIRAGKWREIDVWAFPATCNTFRNALDVIFPVENERLRFPCVFPDSADASGAAENMLDRVEAFCEWAGRVSGREVSEGSLDRSVRTYNENRKSFALLEERMAESPGSFSGSEFASLARAGMALPKESHTRILTAALSRLGVAVRTAPHKVFLAGMMPAESVMEALDEAGAAIVGNDLALGHRYYSGSPDEAGDIPLSLARRHLRRNSCFTVHGFGHRRTEDLFRRIVACGADRLILLRRNGCEPETAYVPDMAAESKERGIPFLCLDAGPEAKEKAAAKARIETFLDLGE
jgi:benzoyl-CoA reductase/2-hydroxyglutaryl-CoA dehydratase subunit BcrC/BadD/HgdB